MTIERERRLLILDDEPDVAKTIALIAQKLEFSVKQCSDPEVFFGLLEVWQPTHIALDLVMPAMDGIEVLRRMALGNRGERIILTSGVGSRVLESASRSAVNHGLTIVGILPKPFRPALLRELLMRPSEQSSYPESEKIGPLGAVTGIDIARALADHEFEIYYQPKYDLSTNKVTAFEALIRWNHPAGGMIYPDLFLPFAEKSGYMDVITHRVLEMSFDWMKQLQNFANLKLEVNISASSLKDFGLVEKLVSLCDERGLDRDLITLEITESSAMKDYQAGIDILTRLRLKGFKLAIDDFGTGYSSMTQLTRLPFSELKIDKSFVLPLRHSSEARKIVELTVNLAQNFGLCSVAEGVEDLETMQYLRSIGCDMVQGHYISKPMPALESFNWLAKQ